MFNLRCVCVFLDVVDILLSQPNCELNQQVNLMFVKMFLANHLSSNAFHLNWLKCTVRSAYKCLYEKVSVIAKFINGSNAHILYILLNVINGVLIF